MDKQSFVVLGKWTALCVNMGDVRHAWATPLSLNRIRKPQYFDYL